MPSINSQLSCLLLLVPLEIKLHWSRDFVFLVWCFISWHLTPCLGTYSKCSVEFFSHEWMALGSLAASQPLSPSLLAAQSKVSCSSVLQIPRSWKATGRTETKLTCMLAISPLGSGMEDGVGWVWGVSLGWVAGPCTDKSPGCFKKFFLILFDCLGLSCSMQDLLLWLEGLAAPRNVGSSQTRTISLWNHWSLFC